MIRLVSQSSKLAAVALVAVVMTVVSLSVSGILQSTERLSSSGIIVESAPGYIPPAPPVPSPPPPEPQVEIDVYEDLACTIVQSSIEWGEIEAGASTSVTVYIKNNGDTNLLLGLDSANWTPTNCADFTTLSWDYGDTVLVPGEIREVTITLDVDLNSPPMNSFGFEVVIIAS